MRVGGGKDGRWRWLRDGEGGEADQLVDGSWRSPFSHLAPSYDPRKVRVVDMIIWSIVSREEDLFGALMVSCRFAMGSFITHRSDYGSEPSDDLTPTSWVPSDDHDGLTEEDELPEKEELRERDVGHAR